MTDRHTFSIPLCPLFSFGEVISFLDRGYDECLYRVSEGKVYRLIDINGSNTLITLSTQRKELKVEITKDKIANEDTVAVENYVRDWFDMERDIEPFYKLLENNTAIKHFTIEYSGARLVGIPDLYEALCWAIIGQQINLTFAHKVKRKFVENYGGSTEVDGEVYYTFPSPDEVLRADRQSLIDMQFSRQKIDYIRNVSQAFVDGTLSKSILKDCTTKEERMALLTKIKGVGVWTANYVLMKSLRDPSCITYGDSGLNKALHLIFKTEKRPSIEVVDAIFSEFKGWESYLNFYLWKSLS